MMNDEIWKLDATAQAELVAAGEVTSRELVELALDRIERLDVELGSVVFVDGERALEAASRPRSGPFAGVPFVAKDLLPMPGLRCAMGCRLLAGHVPTEPTPYTDCLLYTSPSPRDQRGSRMPSSA